MEIYNETMLDLLSTLPTSMKAAQISQLQVVEDEQGVYVRGLQAHVAQNEEEALNMLFEVNFISVIDASCVLRRLMKKIHLNFEFQRKLLVAPSLNADFCLILQGETNRAIAAHTLNKQSSRSHCIFTIFIEVI